MKTLSEQFWYLINIKFDVSECVWQIELEREQGRVLIIVFFLVGGYMKDSLKGNMINFQGFHLQNIIQTCPVFTLLF